MDNLKPLKVSDSLWLETMKLIDKDMSDWKMTCTQCRKRYYPYISYNSTGWVFGLLPTMPKPVVVEGEPTWIV